MEAVGTDCGKHEESRSGPYSRKSIPVARGRSVFSEITSVGHPFLAVSSQGRKEDRTRTDSGQLYNVSNRQPIALRLPKTLLREHDQKSSQHTNSVENDTNIVREVCVFTASRQFSDSPYMEAVGTDCI